LEIDICLCQHRQHWRSCI